MCWKGSFSLANAYLVLTTRRIFFDNRYFFIFYAFIFCLESLVAPILNPPFTHPLFSMLPYACSPLSGVCSPDTGKSSGRQQSVFPLVFVRSRGRHGAWWR
ncbi:unnamed protein product, partial [Ascophyllum nodosum]